MHTRCLLLSAVTVSLIALSPFSATGQEKKQGKEAKITYDDHVRPVLRQYCFSCHNQNQAKSGLAVDSYAKLLEGGSGGEVVFEEDLDSSRLWALVNHDEEPTMPANQDKLPDDKLALIRRWIEGGLLENAGSKASTKKKTLNLSVQPTTGKPAGPVAMPVGLGREPVVYTPRAAAVAALASSPWAPLVAVAGQQQICLYHSDTGNLLGILPFADGNPYCLRFSRDGSILLAAGGHAGYAGWVVLYDVKTGKQLVKVGDELDAILAADLNADHTQIAFGGSGRVVRVFSTETGNQLHEIRKHTDWIYAVRFSPDGVLLATADRANGLFVWEADTAREYLNLRGHTAAITDVAWRADSNVLASASMDGTVRLWEMNDGKQIKRWNAHSGGVNAIAYTHDGRLVTVGVDKRTKLWDGNGKPLKTFPAFSEPALRVTFTHDGKRVVAGDWSGTVLMWNANDARQLGVLPPNPPTLAMQIDRATSALDVATRAATKVQTARAVAKKRVDDIQQQINALRDRITKARQAATKNKQDAHATAKTVATHAAAVKKATEALAAAKKLHQSSKEPAKTKSVLDNAQAELKQAQDRLTQAKQRQAALQVAALKLAAQTPQLTKQLPKLEKALQNAKKQLATEQTALDAARKNITATQARLQDLDAAKTKKQ